MSNELKWKWVYIPYLDAPDKQKESAIKAGYAKVYFKSEVDKVIAEKDKEICKLKEMMPKYKQFIKDEDFKKKLVDEYDGYVYEWNKHTYIATPYINILIKGVLRALWLARAERAKDNAIRYGIYGPAVKSLLWSGVDAKCRTKAEEYK